MNTQLNARKRYLRPITLSIIGSSFFEFIIFLIFGLWLFPGGDLVNKFLWSVVFCGIGMGSTVGWLINLIVVDRLRGATAIGVTVIISVIILGLICNLLCISLDQHFNYFGSHEMPTLFLVNGVFMSALGGAMVGWLLFSETGAMYIEKFGL